MSTDQAVVKRPEEDEEFRLKVTEMNEDAKKAELEWARAKAESLEKKKRFDTLTGKLMDFISNYGKPDPQAKLNFGDDDESEESDEDFDDAPPSPVAASESATPVASMDDSPGILTIDAIDAKTGQALVDAGIKTVKQFFALMECENPEYPRGPENITAIKKKARDNLTKVYAELRYGDVKTPYSAPLPAAAVAAEPPLADDSPEVDEAVTAPQPVVNEEGQVLIKLLIPIAGKPIGESVYGTLVGKDASVTIAGEEWGLSASEFEIQYAS